MAAVLESSFTPIGVQVARGHSSAQTSTSYSCASPTSRCNLKAPGAPSEHFLGAGVAELKQYSSCEKPYKARVTMMANKGTGGVFAPIVVLAKNVIGQKRFNQLRGKGIALHSQVITEFCKSVGADAKQRQGLIRLAKKNGEKLGFLA